MLTSLDSVLTATSLDLLTLDDDPLPPETRQRLLRFALGLEDSALLPLEQITEILRLNVTEILPVPEMPSCVLGIGNWRGEMLWLVDLNHLVGYSPLSSVRQVSASPVAMVVQVNDQAVGLVVQQVNDIELHELQQLGWIISAQAPAFCLGSFAWGKWGCLRCYSHHSVSPMANTPGTSVLKPSTLIFQGRSQC